MPRHIWHEYTTTTSWIKSVLLRTEGSREKRRWGDDRRIFNPTQAAASSEQSAGIEQVNQAITQMDEITQQNAALVEQAAAAAESMQGQAEQLARAVAVFKLDRASAVTVPKISAARKRLHVVGGSDEEEWEAF